MLRLGRCQGTPKLVTMTLSELCGALSHLVEELGWRTRLQSHSGRTQLHPALSERPGSVRPSRALLSSRGPGSRVEAISTL